MNNKITSRLIKIIILGKSKMKDVFSAFKKYQTSIRLLDLY